MRSCSNHNRMQRLSYISEFHEKSSKLASYSVLNGILKGDHVGILGPSTLEWLISEMGILISGAVIVHLSFDINDRRHIKEYLDNCDCKLYILDPGEFYDIVQAVSIYLQNAASKSSLGKDSSSILLMKKKQIIAYNIEYPVVFPEDTVVVMSTSGIDYDITVGTGNSKRYTDRPFSWISGFPVVYIFIWHSVVFTDARLTSKKDR
ncbi:hypothetical protein KUTeg_019733 [Tegillarca granosa]|uniref:AMP-dependent synthetase/ligase domain-containing protein n=1 Tax=Tegillarca granosa TaxID=220873 RepID=A0ABQ9EDG0_TEGGR|nr:hypothetical protein KUTeg_019733 [Tegillarca granosa]